MNFAARAVALIRERKGVKLRELARLLSTGDDPMLSVYDRLYVWLRADTTPPGGIQARRCGTRRTVWLFDRSVTLKRTIAVFESEAGTVKVCNTCGEAWPLSCYERHPCASHGRDNRCIECNMVRRARGKSWRPRWAVERRGRAA